MPQKFLPKAEPYQINKALMAMKKSISSGSIRFIEGRDKNMKTLAILGITTEHVYDMIYKLSYKNYLNGPGDDRDIPEDKLSIWEFGYQFDDKPIYIKIKIKHDNNAICISFHIAEKKLHFHYI